MSFPKTEAGQNELSHRVAAAHAAAVNQQLKSLKCPDSQKLLLLNAIIDTVKSNTREPI